VNSPFYGVIAGCFTSIDINTDREAVEAAAPDSYIKAVIVGVKLTERKAVICRSARQSIQYLYEGMGVIPEENTRYDGDGLCTPLIDQFEVPAFEACPAATHHVLEVEILRAPDIF
jgi:hypothetical protein